MTTTIIIPCFNEADRLNLEAFNAFASDHANVQLIFVNDGSTDLTAATLDKLKAACPEAIDVCHLEKNSGKAEAVRQGMLKGLQSDPDYIGYWDADLATPLADVKTFRSVLEANNTLSLVMGARVAMLGRSIDRKLLRHYIGRIIGTFISLTLGVHVYDTQCGAKLFRVTHNTGEVFKEPFVAGWLFDAEMLHRLKKAGTDLNACVYEFPLVSWHDVAGSKLTLSHFPKIMVSLWRLYRLK